MSWSRRDRTSYQASLRKARSGLMEAHATAADAGDEGAVTDIGGIMLEAQRLMTDSLTEHPPRKARTAETETESRSIPGQTRIGTANE